MPTVVLQFSRPDFNAESVFQRMISVSICKETRSEICHVDLEVDGMLIGAHMDGGIQSRPQDYQKWGLRIRVELQVTQEQKDAFSAYAKSMIGTGYDVESICGITLGDSRFHDTDKLICSAFAARAVDEKSHIVRVAKDYWQVSPEELRMVVTAIPGATETRI